MERRQRVETLIIRTELGSSLPSVVHSSGPGNMEEINTLLQPVGSLHLNKNGKGHCQWIAKRRNARTLNTTQYDLIE